MKSRSGGTEVWKESFMKSGVDVLNVSKGELTSLLDLTTLSNWGQTVRLQKVMDGKES